MRQLTKIAKPNFNASQRRGFSPLEINWQRSSIEFTSIAEFIQAIRRTPAREASVSRHHGCQIKGALWHLSNTTNNIAPRGSKGALYSVPHYTDDKSYSLGLHFQSAAQILIGFSAGKGISESLQIYMNMIVYSDSFSFDYEPNGIPSDS